MFQYVLSRSNTNFSPQRVILPLFGKTYLYNSDLHPVFIPFYSCRLIVDKFSREKVVGSIDSSDFTSVLLNSAIRGGGLAIINNDNLGFQLDITKPGSRSVAGFSKTWKIKQILTHYKRISQTQRYFYGREIILNKQLPTTKDGMIYTAYKIIILMLFRGIYMFSNHHNYRK
jgi:hypothetical protein